MIEYTANAEVDGRKFDGVDLFISEPHVSIDSTDDDLKTLADQLNGFDLAAGSIVAPVWDVTGGGSAMGSGEDRKKFLTRCGRPVRLARSCVIWVCAPMESFASIRPTTWILEQGPRGQHHPYRSDFREAAHIAADHGERLAAEGEICWGGMHSWKWMLRTFELADAGDALGFQADLAHSMLYLLGYNAEEHRIVPRTFLG